MNEVESIKDDLADLLPIRGRFVEHKSPENGRDESYYLLTAADGSQRTIYVSTAHTRWANLGWPKRDKYVVLWSSATRKSDKKR